MLACFAYTKINRSIVEVGEECGRKDDSWTLLLVCCCCWGWRSVAVRIQVLLIPGDLFSAMDLQFACLGGESVRGLRDALVAVAGVDLNIADSQKRRKMEKVKKTALWTRQGCGWGKQSEGVRALSRV